MQIIRRTLAIIVAALVVAGIAFGVAQSSGAQSLGPARPMRGAAVGGLSAGGTINADTAGAASPRPERGEHEGNRLPSLFGAVEMLKDLVIIAIIVGLVALATRATRGRRPVGGAGRAGATEGP
jgi:hypothetical protein